MTLLGAPEYDLKMDFTEDQLHRYARHIVLPEVGGVGQEKLLGARVLVVGAGGLGAPLLLYLAAAGIGTLGVVDDDRVELSNLQRQVIHGTGRIGMAKVDSASQAVADVNPEVKLIAHETRLDAANVLELIADYDVIADGSDNFDTRFLLNDACHLAGKTLVSAAILRFEGQLATFKSHLGPEYPCYRCLYREPPPPGLVPSCSEGGVLGALPSCRRPRSLCSLTARRPSSPSVWIGARRSAAASSTRTARCRPMPGCWRSSPRASRSWA